MKRFVLTLLLLATILTISAAGKKQSVTYDFPKREFRGAWIQAVNRQFEGIPAAELQKELSRQLDSLQSCGINAILFQVRVEGDALYKSSLEPWSRYLTGKQGQAPDEDWDPLQFMTEQCHDRGMEIHAWINPFRARTAGTRELSSRHQISLHPERFVQYGDLTLFNPALKENRDYICEVAADIVRRYDIDGFHMDDYFYPYPESGREFNDAQDFRRDNRGFTDKADWRRDNVNKFVEQIYKTIKEEKPWVKFGISPFGIYRNQSASYPDGSKSNGLENYSALYADILYWIEKGWMDYCIPQVYWNHGNAAADYTILTRWWAEHAGGCLMYIGQDVERTVTGKDPDKSDRHQEIYKMDFQRSLQPALMGSCQWPAKSVVDNPAGYRTTLANRYYRYPALQPVPASMAGCAPGKVRKVRKVMTIDGPVLFWTAPKSRSEAQRAQKYVVYRFEKGEKADTNDASHIIAITGRSFYRLSESDSGCTYVISALNRIQEEGDPVRYRLR